MNRRILAGIFVVAGMAAAGCAGRGEAAGEQGSAEDREEAMLAFAECMREHGIDMPDPEEGSGRRPGLRIVRGDRINADPEEMEAAHEACEKHLEGVVQEISPEERAEMQDKAVEFAACMRDNGIDMPDPDFAPGETGAFRQRLGDEFDPDDPDFMAADEKCREEVFGGDGPPGTKGAGPAVVFGPGRAGS